MNTPIFQQDECPCHYHNDARDYLNEHVPHRWIGRIGQNDNALMKWDLTLCDSFLLGFVKGNVYVQYLIFRNFVTGFQLSWL
ncbi:hypothetical protein C0J52_14870 [Blattella germanica]|nr:hypothetical protein C0J52_14870 [Blattella germanica]